MRKITKILAAAAMSATMVCTAMFAGCTTATNGVDGKDGKDGQNVSIYEIYDATNAARAEEGLDQLTFLEFINEYLNYSGDDISQMASMQTTINNALLSGVSLITKFTVITKTYNAFLHSYQETKEEASYAGSGVIIDVDTEKGDMTVITNCHVVYDANGEGDGYCDNISMYLYGGEYNDNNKISAEIIGTCKAFDLAVLKVTDCDLVKGNRQSGMTAKKFILAVLYLRLVTPKATR
jgi:S1-C subfamily serine protease